ncbi:MAG: hypothetical protein II425_05215 [Oscillospiraceae bacterium]|nr:hypothetical protein [Oscillospiraceae bacterium]MBQ1767868.1 hypothetical protein [Oscillospiraceae bacterium]MBQ2157719.1 hypothetical protein [Oscillospiraceae bacterium]MBQ2231191.1 hypothetical protein [Oscillospiraceae bacterium]MBQ2330513.1 hypothetical protein [Oscillospiraceae bacterium]
MELDRMKLRALKLPQPNRPREEKESKIVLKKLTKKQEERRKQDEILYQRLRDFYGFD